MADSSDGRILWRGTMDHRSQKRPARLAATSDGGLILATTWQHQSVQVTKWLASDQRWVEGSVDDSEFSRYGAISVSPDDASLLVAGLNSILKFAVANVTLDGLGPVLGSAKISERSQALYRETTASEILFTADSKSAYVVADNGIVRSLDVQSMSWRGAPLEYPPVHPRRDFRLSRTFAALSPDERLIIINTGAEQGALGQVVLVDTSSWQLRIVDAPGLKESWGLDFLRSGDMRGTLAVHGGSEVALFRLVGMTLTLEATVRIPKPSDNYFGETRETTARFAALAWSGDGTKLIANRGGPGFKEWRLFDLSPTALLDHLLDIDSCISLDNIVEDYRASMGFDVLTLQKQPTHTASPGPANTSTQTPTATATPRPTWTNVPPASSPLPSRTPKPPATPTATAGPTMLYLPLALSEHCSLEYVRSDIALVIDTSSSMTGQKLEDAKDAALLFLGMIDLAPGRSQVAVVRFDREAEVTRELTNARALIEAAIRNLQHRSGTHIDKGLRAALRELQSTRRLARNAQVIVLLTDGVQTGTPGEELRAASELHAADVRVYTTGLGADVDAATLRSIAGAAERYYFAPDPVHLGRIYGEIARDLMCPGVELWGGR